MRYSLVGFVLGFVIGILLPLVFPQILLFESNYAFKQAQQLGTLNTLKPPIGGLLPIILGILGLVVGKFLEKLNK